MGRNRNYRKGIRAEYKLKQMLEERGWVVVRSAGSHGFWDLVAFRFERGSVDILLLQVKAKEPPTKMQVIINRGKFRALEAVVFVAGGRVWLSRRRQLSLDDPFRAFRPSRDAVQVIYGDPQEEQPTGDRQNDHNE